MLFYLFSFSSHASDGGFLTTRAKDNAELEVFETPFVKKGRVCASGREVRPFLDANLSD